MPSYLGILAIGWCYILSARLVELQGQDAKMEYKLSTAALSQQEVGNKHASSITVDIGEVSEDVARWWAAILAPGEGWRAIISSRDDGDYVAPWSVSREDTHYVGIKWSRKTEAPEDFIDSSPPSSSKAFEFLAQFSLQNNLGSQFLVSLATAMTFPTHNYHGTVVQLPFPAAQINDKDQSTPLKSIKPEWLTVNEELPFYMTLSCSPDVITSSLCGMFWDADITCNLVSPWLHPILNEIPEGKGIVETPGLYHEILAITCGLRRPRISALFLGAAASGLLPTILFRARRGSPPLDANAFPWTGSPQSFMDVPGSGPYICEGLGNKVRRADVWRLLYLPPVVEDDLHYKSRPFGPWAPFGNTSVKHCALRVASHLNCARHHMEYQHWNWELMDGSIVEDRGIDKHQIQSHPDTSNLTIELLSATDFPKKPLDMEASEEASLGIFQWVMVSGEGTPAEEIYKDVWLEIGESSDEEADDINEDSSVLADKQHNGLEEWLGGVTETRPAS